MCATDVKRLLLQGVPASACDASGDPAICAASIGGHVAVVEELLMNCASPLQHTTFKETSLHLAARHAHAEVVDHLLNSAQRCGSTGVWGCGSTGALLVRTGAAARDAGRAVLLGRHRDAHRLCSMNVP
jgi:hypothetical protein